MNQKFRDLCKDLFIYSMGDLLLRGVAFLTLPIYTRIFSPEEYGIASFIVTAGGLLSCVLTLGGDTAYARFYFESRSQRDREILTSTWFGFLAVWSGGVVFLGLPFTRLLSEWSFGTQKYGLLFVLVLLGAPLGLMNSMCAQALRNQFRVRLFALLNVVSALLTIGFSVFAVVGLRLGLVGMMGGATLASLVILPVRLWTVRDLLHPVFSGRVLGDLLVFGVPLVPSSFAYWVFAVSDRLLLGKLSTLEQVGLYSVANSLTSVLGFINGALGQAWSPHAIRIYEEERAGAPAFFGQAMTYFLALFGLLSVAATVFAREALTVLSTPPFYPAALAVGPLALGFVASASTQVTALPISLTKNTRYIAIFSWAAAVLNVALNVLLIPRWGMLAASWSTLAAYLFLTMAYLVASQGLWPVAYEKRRALVIVGFTIAFVVVAPLLPALPLVPSIFVKSVYCFVYVSMLFLLGGLDAREWGTISEVLRRKVAVNPVVG